MGRGLYVFLKLVNLVLCVLWVSAYILFSHLGFKAFSESGNIYDPDKAFLYQLGLVLLFISIVPIVSSILVKDTGNPLVFFILTLFNIFILFIITVLFTIADTY